ncbi:MAG: OadG family protein [Clostridia bacterium]|nr:OadG family protein [Clostridia bacterium]
MGKGMLLLAVAEPPLWFVCLVGAGVVFAGLIILIGFVVLMNFISDKIPEKKKEKKQVVTTVETQEIPNRQELIAAICVAIAEDTGTDINAIRVVSFKKV